jgi:hypothetical protein
MTMKTSHTPGPWTIDTDKSSIIMSGQRTIINPAPDGASRDEEIANARLIAAAPDLLAALQRIMITSDRRMADGGDKLDFQDTNRHLGDMARAAIARAIGAT